MARGTQHRKRRPRTNARVASAAPSKPARRSGRAWEDQLFFGRLRAHAQWVFVLLAGGLRDQLRHPRRRLRLDRDQPGPPATSSAAARRRGASLSSLQKQTVEHPKNATAWLNYANKLEQTDQDDDGDRPRCSAYTKLRPKDQNALLELAGLYLAARQRLGHALHRLAERCTQALDPDAAPSARRRARRSARRSAALPNPIATAVSSAVGHAARATSTRRSSAT